MSISAATFKGLNERRNAGETRGRVVMGRGKTMADMQISIEEQKRLPQLGRTSPLGCAACASRRPGWFCSLGSAVLADLELATSTISLPSQAALFTEGEDARCLYLICSGYLKLYTIRDHTARAIMRSSASSPIASARPLNTAVFSHQAQSNDQPLRLRHAEAHPEQPSPRSVPPSGTSNRK